MTDSTPRNSPDTHSAAKCRGIGLKGRHKWVRVYQGATLDAYKCVNIGCGEQKTTEGTALRGR